MRRGKYLRLWQQLPGALEKMAAVTAVTCNSHQRLLVTVIKQLPILPVLRQSALSLRRIINIPHCTQVDPTPGTSRLGNSNQDLSPAFSPCRHRVDPPARCFFPPAVPAHGAAYGRRRRRCRRRRRGPRHGGSLGRARSGPFRGAVWTSSPRSRAGRRTRAAAEVGGGVSGPGTGHGGPPPQRGGAKCVLGCVYVRDFFRSEASPPLTRDER